MFFTSKFRESQDFEGLSIENERLKSHSNRLTMCSSRFRYQISLSMILLFCAVNSYELKTNEISYVGKYIAGNIKASRIKIFTESLEQMTGISFLIMQDLMKVFPTILTETYFLNEDSNRVNDLLCWWPDRNVPIVVFVHENSQADISNQLIEMIDLVINWSPKSPRPKLLIIVTTTSLHVNFLSIFKLAWGYQVLDISIMEIFEHGDKKFLDDTVLEVSIHKYNPFENNYTETRLESNISIFSNKLKDLHGKVFNASYYEEIPFVTVDANCHGNEIWNAMKGTQISLLNAIAKFLNFSIRVTHASVNYTYLSRFAISYDPSHSMLEKGLVDFTISPYIISVDISLEDKLFTAGSLTFITDPNRIIVRQIGRKSMHVPINELMALVAVTIGLIIIATTLKRLLRDRQVWNGLNIFRILLRMDVFPQPNEPSHKFFMLCLICWSIMFMEQILDNLLNIQLTENTYHELNNYQELLNSKIVPSLTHERIQDMIQTNDSIFWKLATKSKLIKLSNDDCLWQLMNDNDDVEGCEVSNYNAELAIKAYSRRNRGSILTVVKEPLFNGMGAMSFAKTSPYVLYITHIVKRLQDGGIIQMFYSTFDHDKLYRFQNFESNRSDTSFLFEQNIFKISTTSLITLIVIGDLIGFISFALESIWNRRTCKIKKNKSKTFETRYSEIFKKPKNASPVTRLHIT